MCFALDGFVVPTMFASPRASSTHGLKAEDVTFPLKLLYFLPLKKILYLLSKIVVFVFRF